jgi:uncharacterized protein (TIRG00374 family)
MKKITLKKIARFFPIIGVLLFIYILYNTGIEKITSTFVLIPLYFFILAFLPFFPRILLRTYRWEYICKKQKIKISYFNLLKIYLIGLYYGLVTPLGIGWHVRSLYLKKRSKSSIEKCLANSMIDTSTQYLAQLVLAFFGSIILIEFFPGIFPLILIALALNLAVFSIFLKKSSGSKLVKIFIRPIIPKRYKGKFDKFLESIYEDIPRLRDLVFPLFIDFVLLILAATQTYIIALAFSVDVPYLIFVLITIVCVTISTLLPVTIGGLGIREGAFVVILSHYNVAPAVAVVISLSGFIVKIVVPSMIGLVLSFKEKLEIEELKKEAEEI